MMRPMKERRDKKAYRPPTLRSQQVYERRSLACGKSDVDSEQCIMSPQNS